MPPFENAIDPKFFYESPFHAEVMLRLTYAVSARKGMAVLVGDVGCGKTMICRVYLERVPRDLYDIFFISQFSSLSEEDTLKEILYTLGRDKEIPQGASRIDLLRDLNDRLMGAEKNGKHTILVIDEAQLMNQASLEMVRVLLNYQFDINFLCTIILVGQPELRANIHRLPQLEQRISMNYYLKPLDYESVISYVNFRVTHAGCNKAMFQEEALKKILYYSTGVARKINNICDLSLLIGFSEKKEVIDEAIIDRVAEELLYSKA